MAFGANTGKSGKGKKYALLIAGFFLSGIFLTVLPLFRPPSELPPGAIPSFKARIVDLASYNPFATDAAGQPAGEEAEAAETGEQNSLETDGAEAGAIPVPAGGNVVNGSNSRYTPSGGGSSSVRPTASFSPSAFSSVSGGASTSAGSSFSSGSVSSSNAGSGLTNTAKADKGKSAMGALVHAKSTISGGNSAKYLAKVLSAKPFEGEMATSSTHKIANPEGKVAEGNKKQSAGETKKSAMDQLRDAVSGKSTTMYGQSSSSATDQATSEIEDYKERRAKEDEESAQEKQEQKQFLMQMLMQLLTMLLGGGINGGAAQAAVK